MHGAVPGVEHPAVGGRHRARAQGVDHRPGGYLAAGAGVGAAHREGPLVVVVVAAEHQVHLVPVEQRQPLLPDAEVGAVAGGRGGGGALVHLDDDPVHRLVPAAGRQRPLQPGGLRPAGVAPDVERRARLDRRVAGARRRGQRRRARHERGRVLEDHVVGVERDEQHRADAEGVPAAAEAGHPVVRQGVAGQVGGEALRAVVELHLVVAQARHPGPVRGGGLVVVAEVAPHLGLGRGVQVRVAQVAVEQVEQRLEGFHRLDCVRALAVGEHPRGVGRGQVAEAGEAERGPARRRGAERGAERVGGVAVVVRGHRVGVRGAGPQAADAGMVGPDRLAADSVGVGAGLGRDHPLPDPHPRPPRLAGGGPGDDDPGGRVLAPGEVDLLGGAVARGARPARPRRCLRRAHRGREQAGAAGAGQYLAA